MRIIDADALLATLLYKRPLDDDKDVGRPEFRAFVDGCVRLLDAAPTPRCDGCEHFGVCEVSRAAWGQFAVQPFSCSCWTARAEEGRE